MFPKRLFHGSILMFALACTVGASAAIAQAPPLLLQWGSYGAGPGQFDNPQSLAVDGQGHVFVGDTYNHRVEKFTTGGDFLLAWGVYGTGDGQFGDPLGVAVDAAGNVYVSEDGASIDFERIQKFTSDSLFITTWGSRGSGNDQLYFPEGMALAPSGVLYVADMYNNRIVEFGQDGRYLGQWNDPSRLGSPTDVAIDKSGYIYVVNLGYRNVLKYTSDGSYVGTFGTYSLNTDPGDFVAPWGCAVDSDGNLYVTDEGRNVVEVFNSSGTPLMQWGSAGPAPGQFNQPHGIRIDSTNRIYVVDYRNNRIEVFGRPTVPTHNRTWGAVKAQYR